MPRRNRLSFRRPFRALLLALAVSVVAGLPAQADGYLGALEDVPLMPGLAEVPNVGLEFEAATGRIVEAVATGIRKPGLDRQSVLSFYRESLPPLGWRPVDATHFVREREQLKITVEEMPDRVTVRYGLKPR